MIEDIYCKFTRKPTVTTDSRNVPAGSIFFALQGKNVDGNRFAHDALRSGASWAVIDNAAYYTDGCILVDDALETLQSLANYHRKKLGVKVIGITGSNGKTTTKELLFSVLSAKYKVSATKGNLNNHIGVPLTLLSLTEDIDMAIVEMGANHPGDIRELVDIAEPNFGIITNIGRAHLGGFGSVEGVINTKSELYQYISEHDGVVFYNQNNPILDQLVQRFELRGRAIQYGDICRSVEIMNINQSPFLNLNIGISEKVNTLELRTSLVGNYNTENILAAITVGRYLGVNAEDIRKAIEGYVPTNSRSQLLKTPHNTIIVDAYNANPSSMEVAIRNFAGLASISRVAILGEMLELGPYSTDEHLKIVTLLKDFGIRAILVGKGFDGIYDNFQYFEDAGECAKYLRLNPITNSAILLKGSRGVGLEKVLECL